MFKGQQPMSDDFGNASTGNQSLIHRGYSAYGFGWDELDWLFSLLSLNNKLSNFRKWAMSAMKRSKFYV